MRWLNNFVKWLTKWISPRRPRHLRAHIVPVRFHFRGEVIMKHLVRLHWVESAGSPDFPIANQHLVVKVADSVLVDTDVAVGTNVFDFAVDAEVDVHCELTASNNFLTSAPAVLDFRTPAFPPVPTVPDAPTNFTFELVGTQE